MEQLKPKSEWLAAIFAAPRAFTKMADLPSPLVSNPS
jgi:hypothetical protein